MTPSVVVSILALVLSIVSLSWQTWTWRRSGPMLETNAVRVRAGSDRYVKVEAINSGRSAATVKDWGFELPDGRQVKPGRKDPAAKRRSASLPARVDSHGIVGFYVPLAELQDLSAEAGTPGLRAWVKTAAGKRVYATETISVS